MSKFKQIGGRYGMHSGSGKFINVEVVNDLNVRGISFPLIQGDVRYVNSANATTGDGTTWLKAFSTIQEAVTAANAHDTILIAGTTNTAASQTNDYSENVTIPTAKVGLRIIGMGVEATGIKWTPAAQNGTCLTINAKDCLVENIQFRPNGTTGAAISLPKDVDLANNAEGTVIRNCLFKSTSQDSVGITATAPNDILVENCIFAHCTSAYVITATPNAVAYRNVFRNCQIESTCTNGIVGDFSYSYFLDCVIGRVTTMNLQTDAVGGAGVENVVFGCFIDCAEDAYEDDCSSDANTAWWGSYCSDVGNTDVASNGEIQAYPHQA